MSQKIQRAILSVTDKTGLTDFARKLSGMGVELISTGGTAKQLRDAGIGVKDISELTGFPEMLDGRVKTLHPKVHGGILHRREDEAHRTAVAEHGIQPIDMVVVNLYAFEKTASKAGVHFEEVIENIDIGGPSMLRSAAKNHARVGVLCDPADYGAALQELADQGSFSARTRQKLAAKAFAHTAAYDAAISGYLSGIDDGGERRPFPAYLTLPFERVYGLRYGENPHQSGAFYRERDAVRGSLATAESLGTGAKELSFNNLVDADAAFQAVREFEAPAAVVVKHTNPCGVAVAETLASAYRTAREADPVSAFGCVVALNRPVEVDTAKAIAETFVECVVAPAFSGAALEVLRAKKNLRLLATGALLAADEQTLEYKRVSGGLVVQTRDATGGGEVRAGRVVTKRAPTADELSALEFAWRVGKHVKSNAIVLAKGGRTVGVGAGQMSRVVSVQIACEKAGREAEGSVMASDAFFPFADGVEAAIARGITAIAQPGGSVKDPEVIAAADQADVAMVFTGARHFRH
jgi:phosphoribosylaminoimidazolecarboxamide formyltransferase/IMP cyclohydrolase